MKKKLCLVLVLMLLTVAFGASAEKVRLNETSGDFVTELSLPDGAKIVSTQAVGDSTITVVAKDGVATVRIVIAPSELYDNTQSLGDLPEAEKDALLQTVCEQYENVVSSLDKTPSGNEYFYIDTDGESDMHIIFTLYMGYCMELTQWHDDYATLNDADIDFHLDLAHNLWVVPN